MVNHGYILVLSLGQLAVLGKLESELDLDAVPKYDPMTPAGTGNSLLQGDLMPRSNPGDPIYNVALAYHHYPDWIGELGHIYVVMPKAMPKPPAQWVYLSIVGINGKYPKMGIPDGERKQ